MTTVSRVMNNNYPVKKETRERVEAAIETLSFRPNLLAKGLIQNCTKTLGILTPSIENLFFSEVVKGIDMTLKTWGYTTFLCNTEGDPKNEKEMTESLLNRSVDGLILIDPRTEHIKNGYYEKLSHRVPLVIINGYATGIQCNYVINDAEAGTLSALKHFYQQGHRQIALLRGRKSYSYDIKENIYRQFMAEHSLVVDTGSIIMIETGNGLQTVEEAKTEVEKRLKQANPPTAILACNDWMAVGALSGSKNQGLKIPQDISIIGFDNTILSQITEPKLSTVDQKMTQLGQLAASRILELIEQGDKENKKIMLETNLIIRES